MGQKRVRQPQGAEEEARTLGAQPDRSGSHFRSETRGKNRPKVVGFSTKVDLFNLKRHLIFQYETALLEEITVTIERIGHFGGVCIWQIKAGNSISFPLNKEPARKSVQSENPWPSA